MRRAGNAALDVAQLRALAEAAGVELIGVDGGLASGGFADLGGNEFDLLVAPRIALVAGTGTNSYSFGVTWHLLDSRLRLRTSIVDVSRVAGCERVDVLIVIAEHGTYTLAGRTEGSLVRAVHSTDPLLSDLLVARLSEIAGRPFE